MDFTDKVVIVTGGANGIGKATARRFHELGARVAIWDMADAAGEALADELGDNAAYHSVNVAEGEAVEATVNKVVEAWGGINVIVNNAGITRDGQLVKYKEGAVQKIMSDEQFDAVINVNLKGVFVGTRAVVPHMIEAGGGVILNAASVVGLYGNFGQSNYVATKSGVIGMTKVWARELGRYNIRVNAVAPGFIATEMITTMPEKVVDKMVGGTPLNRLGQPEDIANAYAFLASDEASFITGHTLSVDGGVVIGT